ncbi:MAG TPA: type IIL restriction-modification enzyme MmeI, partial [Ktedonobacteraceae bacterium]
PMRQALNLALPRRHAISMTLEKTVKDVAEKERKLREVNEALEVLKLGADLLVAQALYKKDPPAYKAIWNHLYAPYMLLLQSTQHARENNFTVEGRQYSRAAFQNLRAKVNTLLVAEADKLSAAELGQYLSDNASPELLAKIAGLTQARTPFHWPLEFPEVFAKGGDGKVGFAAVLGNPPFQGGSKITGILGLGYREYLVEYLARGKRGNGDLCAYFFLSAANLVQHNGMCALLATNTIAQGDTREVGLDQILASEWTVPRAISSRPWPGEASLEIAHVWLRRGSWQGLRILDDTEAKSITSFLTSPGKTSGKPYSLRTNAEGAFSGSYILGMGFALTPKEAQALITKDIRNKEVIFPFLNGEDLNTHFSQQHNRWVINFRDWPLEKAEAYSDCIDIVRTKVKPERDLYTDKNIREKWWIYKRPTIALYAAIQGQEKVLVCSEVTKYLSFCFVENGLVYSSNLDVFASYSYSLFAVLQSSLHEAWARLYCSQLETRLKYAPGNGFETFPFPKSRDFLLNMGERYHIHRQSIMLTRQEGLTDTYNRFHNPNEQAPDILRLRALHREMDEAVARAYGWDDLELGHGFHETKQGLRWTISEEARREVLDRLLLLNHQRHAEEVAAGLVDASGKPLKAKKTGKTKGGKASATVVESIDEAEPAPVQALEPGMQQGELF